MSIELDHSIVMARQRDASARQLAQLLGVPSGPAAAGPFYAVYVNDGLTLDFESSGQDFPAQHYCFRVSEEAFDQILGRIQAAGIDFRSDVMGPVDHQVGRRLGGRGIYWNVPEGHVWEILTVSYARPPRL